MLSDCLEKQIQQIRGKIKALYLLSNVDTPGFIVPYKLMMCFKLIRRIAKRI